MTDQTRPQSPRIVTATSRPPLRLWGWPLWGWLALVLAAVATLAYEGYALFWLSFGVSAVHPAPEDVAAVTKASQALGLTIPVPWLLAAIALRRVRVLIAALVCALPAIWFWWGVSRTH